jgi:alkanesulfonate monooxygenase SsuD/methylene tetrahydromethanopterin reductase-like flavin-dependent oxidoreductase (luciferase family)
MPVTARRAIFVAPFEELSEPALVAELAAQAEGRGWDGFFVWDHVAYAEPVKALADPWVTLAAVAMRTERVVIGPLVTPLPRRRRHLAPHDLRPPDHPRRGRVGDRGGSLVT